MAIKKARVVGAILELPIILRGIIGFIGDADVLRDLMTEGTWTHEALQGFLAAQNVWVAFALVGVGLIWWSVDWWTPGRKKSPLALGAEPVTTESDHLSLHEAAAFYYDKAPPGLKADLVKGACGDLLSTCRSLILEAAESTPFPLYGKRLSETAHEEIADFSGQRVMGKSDLGHPSFSDTPKWLDVQVERSDILALLAGYERDG